jgi:hypothetical protein
MVATMNGPGGGVDSVVPPEGISAYPIDEVEGVDGLVVL